MQFKFHEVLKYFLPWNGWIVFSRLNAIKEFANPFLSLNLHAVNILIWKKVLSLTLFKIITVSRSSTLLRVFLMGVSGCPTKGGNLGVFQQARKFELSNSVGYYPHQKIKFSCPLIILHILKKRYLLQILDKFYQNFLLRHAFSVTQSWLIWKSSFKPHTLIQNSVQQDYLSELSPINPLNIYRKA